MNEQGHSKTSSNCDPIILKDQIQKEFIKENTLDSNNSDSNNSDSSSSQVKIIIEDQDELNNKVSDSKSNEQRSSVIVQPSRITVITDNNSTKPNDDVKSNKKDIDKVKDKDKPKDEDKPLFLCESKLSQSVINNLFNPVKQQLETNSSSIKLRPSVLKIGESSNSSLNENTSDSTKHEKTTIKEKTTNKETIEKEETTKSLTSLFKFTPLTDNKKPIFGSFSIANSPSASSSSLTQATSSFGALASNSSKNLFLTNNGDNKATSTNYFTENLFQPAVAQSSSSNTLNNSPESSTFNLTKSKNNEQSTAFVFGQNLQDRVTNVFEKSKLSAANSQPSTSQLTDAISPSLTSELTSDITTNISDIATTSGTSNASEKRKFENITGEEEETNVMHIYCKLFHWDSESSAWKERGKGNLRLNDKYDEERTTSRLIMRTAGSLKLVLNCLIINGMKFELTNNCIRFSNVDGIYLIKGKQNDIEQIYTLIQQRLKMLPKRRPEIKQIEEDDKSLENSFEIKDRLKLNKDNDEESVDIEIYKREENFKNDDCVKEDSKKLEEDKKSSYESKKANDEIKSKDNCIKNNGEQGKQIDKKDEIKDQED